MAEARVEEFVADGDDGREGPEDDGWDGTKTRLKIAYPLMRDQAIVPADPQHPIAVEFNAAYIRAERHWIGPEASHVEDLFTQGMVYGSKEQQARESRQAAVDHGRGVFGTEDHPQGFPELGPEARTGKVAQRVWERALAGGSEEVLRKEKQESHRDDSGDKGTGQWPGAQAPGSRARGGARQRDAKGRLMPKEAAPAASEG